MRSRILAVLAAALFLTGCPTVATADCQTFAALQGGYVVRFVRSGPAAPGCDTATPAETGDIWIFDTLADSQIVARSLLMDLPDIDVLPENLVGSGKFTTRQSDGNDRCLVSSLTTMSDDSSGTLLSYQTSDMEWLGGARYQGSEFKAEVVMTVATCSATYQAQALSPRVGCQSDDDCDPFKVPLSSGINSAYDQGCTSDPWTANVTAFTGSTGVCFFHIAFPGLK